MGRVFDKFREQIDQLEAVADRLKGQLSVPPSAEAVDEIEKELLKDFLVRVGKGVTEMSKLDKRIKAAERSMDGKRSGRSGSRKRN